MCILSLYRDVGACGGFLSSVGKTAAPKVKSQVSRRACISYTCFGVYGMHVHMAVKRGHATAADVCERVSMQAGRVGAVQCSNVTWLLSNCS